MADAPDTTTAPHPDPWRHVVQCVIAEQRARLSLEDAVALGGEDSAMARTAQGWLDTEGVRLNGALDALRDDLAVAVRGALDDMRRAS